MPATAQFLTTTDLPALNQLQPPAWDNIIPDFAHYIESPYCTPLKISWQGKIVAIGTTIAHTDTIWLAKIIVDTNYRNRGLGTAITQALIDSIDRNRYETTYLIATDMGYPVYQKMGFVVETTYTIGTGTYLEPKATLSSANIIPFEPQHYRGLLELDQQMSGEDRGYILSNALQQAQVYIKNNRVCGFYLPALYNGLIVANEKNIGIELMKIRLQKDNYAIFPTENQVALSFVQQLGFQTRQHSPRMFLGKHRTWQPQQLFNRIGGQLG